MLFRVTGDQSDCFAALPHLALTSIVKKLPCDSSILSVGGALSVFFAAVHFLRADVAWILPRIAQAMRKNLGFSKFDYYHYKSTWDVQLYDDMRSAGVNDRWKSFIAKHRERLEQLIRNEAAA